MPDADKPYHDELGIHVDVNRSRKTAKLSPLSPPRLVLLPLERLKCSNLVIVGGITLTAGGSAATIDGATISLATGASGLVLLPTNVGFAPGNLLLLYFHVGRAGSFYLSALVACSLFTVTVLVLASITTAKSGSSMTIYSLIASLTTSLTLNGPHHRHLPPRQPNTHLPPHPSIHILHRLQPRHHVPWPLV